MDTNILTILKELRQRCEASDAEIMEQLGVGIAEFQLFQASLYESSIDTNLLASKTGLSVSRLSRIIEKMVQNGYLVRTEKKEDRRVICLHFTDKGKEILAQLEENRRSCERKFTEILSDEDQNNLIKSLSFLINNI